MNQILPPTEYLSRIKPFFYLSREDISYLVQRMSISLYKSGKTVFKRGKVLDRIFLVRSGEIGLFYKNELVETIGEGEFIGWSSALKKEKTEFEGRAVSDTVCFEFKAKDIMKILPKNQKLSEFVNNLVLKRFGELVHSDENEIVKIFSLKVSEAISRPLVTCTENSTLIDVIQLMNKEGVGSVIVLDESKNPRGIITHSDLVRLLAKGIENLSKKAGDVMTSPVRTVESTSPLFDAYRKFVEYGINHLAVVEDGKVVGVITAKNLLKHFEPQISLLNISRSVRGEESENFETMLEEVEIAIERFIHLGFGYDKISAIIVPVTDGLIKKMLEKFGNNSTLAVVGSFGRREVEFPVVYELLTFDEQSTKALEFDFVIVSDLSEFRESVEALSKLIDSRYLHGERKKYTAFMEKIRKEINDKKEDIKSALLETSPKKIRQKNCCEVIGDFARYLSILRGDFLPKSTADRLKESNIPNSESASEAYLAVKFVKLKQKILGKTEKIESFIVKESILYLRKYVGEVLRIIENDKRFS